MDVEFVDAVRDGILSLPQDMKAVLRVLEDPEVDDESRITLAGAVLHVLSASNAIPGMRGILAYVDDTLVLRLALERAEKKSPEAIARHRQESPDLFGPLDDQLKATRKYLGELMTVLEHAVDGVARLSFQGHTAKACVSDTESSTWLYDTVHGAIVEALELDEDVVTREVKEIDKILPHLKARVSMRP